MSGTDKPLKKSPSALYERFAEAIARHHAPSSFLSGFSDTQKEKGSNKWCPFGELPERFFDRDAQQKQARFCIFDGRAYLGVLGAAFTEFERKKRAGTRQKLTVVLNGSETSDVEYDYDGRQGWMSFPVTLPAALSSKDIRAVEIERDGKLILSQFVSEDPSARYYHPKIWLVNASGRLFGSADAVSNVPVEVRVDGSAGVTLTSCPLEIGRDRPFEFDLTLRREGVFSTVAAFNPATGAEATRSPVGVFVSQGEYFLFANASVREGCLSAALLSWKNGKRRVLSLGHAEYADVEIIADVNLEDKPERFEGGNNTFMVAVARVQRNDTVIFDENRKIVGRLPPLESIVQFTNGVR